MFWIALQVLVIFALAYSIAIGYITPIGCVIIAAFFMIINIIVGKGKRKKKAALEQAAKKKAEEAAAKKKAEALMSKKQTEVQAAKKKAEEAAAKKKAEDAAAKKKAEEAAAKKKMEEQAAKKKMEELTAKLEQAAKKKAEEERLAKEKAAKEQAAKKKTGEPAAKGKAGGMVPGKEKGNPGEKQKYFCAACGKSVDMGSSFCKYCGAPVKSSTGRVQNAKQPVNPVSKDKKAGAGIGTGHCGEVVLQAGICPVCGNKTGDADSVCQKCGFPVISFAGDCSPEETKRIRAAVKEYREKYFG